MLSCKFVWTCSDSFVVVINKVHTITIETQTEVGIYKRKRESKKKKERIHALDQETDQEKKKVFRFENQFYFQPLSVICRFDQMKYI